MALLSCGWKRFFLNVDFSLRGNRATTRIHIIYRTIFPILVYKVVILPTYVVSKHQLTWQTKLCINESLRQELAYTHSTNQLDGSTQWVILNQKGANKSSNLAKYIYQPEFHNIFLILLIQNDPQIMVLEKNGQ